MRGVGRGALVAAGAAVAVMALTACSSNPTTLGTVTTSASTATSSAPATSSGTAPTSSGPSTTSASAPVSQVRQPLPGGLAENTRPLTDAYFAYWDFATKAYSNPTSGDIVAGVGSVAAGAAAAQILSDVSSLKSSNQRMVGTVTSTVKSASFSASTGSVCAASRDFSYPVDAQGKPAAVPISRDFTFKADLSLAGPTWRVEKVVGVQSC